jgi:hypothetical protein
MSTILVFGNRCKGKSYSLQKCTVGVLESVFDFEKKSIDVNVVYARLEVLIVVLLKILLLCDVMPC